MNVMKGPGMPTPSDEPQDKEWELELEWEHPATLPGIKRGRHKVSGKVLIETLLDEQGRSIENKSYDEDGALLHRTVWVHDNQRKPLLRLGFDGKGRLVLKQWRGRRPELYYDERGERPEGGSPPVSADA